MVEARPIGIGTQVVGTGGAERATAADLIRRDDHPITGCGRRDVDADRVHLSGSFHPSVRGNGTYSARSGQKVEVVDGDGEDPHESFIPAGSRRRDLQPESLKPPKDLAGLVMIQTGWLTDRSVNRTAHER